MDDDVFIGKLVSETHCRYYPKELGERVLETWMEKRGEIVDLFEGEGRAGVVGFGDDVDYSRGFGWCPA